MSSTVNSWGMKDSWESFNINQSQVLAEENNFKKGGIIKSYFGKYNF